MQPEPEPVYLLSPDIYVSSNITNGTDTTEHAWWEILVFAISGGFTSLACLLSLLLIIQHLRYFSKPYQQRHIVRLLIMVPVYSIDSWLSVRYRQYSLYFDIARDCYEAYALYQFYALLVSYLGDGTEERVLKVLASKDHYRLPAPLCCFPKVFPGPLFFVTTKQLILQYVIIKPSMTILAVILNYFELYAEGHFDFTKGYIYIAFITNASVTVSMYCMVLFYVVTKEELAPHHPVAKVLCIKAILFFSFWQSVLLSGLSYFKVIHSVGEWSQEEVTTALNDFCICVEMFILALIHPVVFSWKEYIIDGQKRRKFKHHVSAVKNFGHVLNQKDLITDIKEAYDPANVKDAQKKQKKHRGEKMKEKEDEMLADEDEINMKKKTSEHDGGETSVSDNDDENENNNKGKKSTKNTKSPTSATATTTTTHDNKKTESDASDESSQNNNASKDGDVSADVDDTDNDNTEKVEDTDDDDDDGSEKGDKSNKKEEKSVKSSNNDEEETKEEEEEETVGDEEDEENEETTEDKETGEEETVGDEEDEEDEESED